MTQPNDPLNSDQQSLHYETTRQNVSAQAHGRRVIAALQANPRPPVTRWRAGVAGTAPDGTRFVLYRQHIRAAGSRAWRTNNPGNVYINALSRQNGAIGRDKRYAVFPDMPTGVRALKALVHSFAHSRARIHKVLNSLAPSNAGQEQVDIQTHTHAFARQLNLDPDASFESLKDADLEQLSQAIVSAGEGEQAGQIYLPGSPNTPPWANAVFEMAQASTSSTSSSGTVASNDDRCYLGDPLNWQAGVWYIRGSDGYDISPIQNPDNFSPGIYVQWNGGGSWLIRGLGAPSQPTQDMQELLELIHADAMPGTGDPNYYAVNTFQLDSGLTIIEEHYPPGVKPTTVPISATVMEMGDGSIIVQYDNQSPMTPVPYTGPDPEPDPDDTTTEQ